MSIRIQQQYADAGEGKFAAVAFCSLGEKAKFSWTPTWLPQGFSEFPVVDVRYRRWTTCLSNHVSFRRIIQLLGKR